MSHFYCRPLQNPIRDGVPNDDLAAIGKSMPIKKMNSILAARNAGAAMSVSHNLPSLSSPVNCALPADSRHNSAEWVDKIAKRVILDFATSISVYLQNLSKSLTV